MTPGSSPSPGFAGGLVRDPDRGELRGGDARYLLVRQDSLMGLFRRLPSAARGDALAAFAAAVNEAGGRSAARYSSAVHKEAALPGIFAETAAQLGWGVWTFTQPAAGELRLSVANSPFAAGFGPSEGPVCAAIAGMASAIASAIFGRTAAAEETQCAAAGANCCRFVARVAAP